MYVVIFRFKDKESLTESLKMAKKKKYNRTMIPAFVTTAKYIQNSSPLKSAIVLKGVPDKMNSDELKEKLPVNIKSATDWIYVDKGHNLALVWMQGKEPTSIGKSVYSRLRGHLTLLINSGCISY